MEILSSPRRKNHSLVWRLLLRTLKNLWDRLCPLSSSNPPLTSLSPPCQLLSTSSLSPLLSQRPSTSLSNSSPSTNSNLSTNSHPSNSTSLSLLWAAPVHNTFPSRLRAETQLSTRPSKPAREPLFRPKRISSATTMMMLRRTCAPQLKRLTPSLVRKLRTPLAVASLRVPNSAK